LLGTRIARAFVNHPALVLADEPTGALDSTTSSEIMDLLTDLNKQGTTIAIVTHDANVAARTTRIIRMVDGIIVEPGRLIFDANEKPLDRQL
jgi:putative ABC transport system ATP-binding protein